MSAAWFYNHRGRLQGPFEADKIIEKIVANELGPDDLVYQEGEDKWQPVSVITQFAKAVPKPSKTEAKKNKSSSDQWVVLQRVKGKANKQLGPYSTAEMRGMLSRSELRLSDYVWRTGMKEWYRVQVFTELVEESLQAAVEPPVVPELPADLPENTQTSTMAKEVVQIHYEEVTANEPMPEEAEGPDLAKVKNDPRDDEILEERVKYKLRPDAIQRIRETVNSGSSVMEIFRDMFSGSGARWTAIGASILLVLFIAGQVLDMAKDMMNKSKAEKVTELPVEETKARPRAKAKRKVKPKPQSVVAAAQPSPTPPKPTAEPKQPASFLKISYDSKGGKLRVDTDASSHFAATFKFTSVFAKVLGRNSYYRVLRRKDRQLKLRELNWPRGYYFLEAQMGDLSSKATVFVGSGKGYSRELKGFKKRMTLDFMNERVDYIKISTRLLNKARSFENILGAAGNARAWSRDFGPWRRSFKRTNHPILRSIGPKSRSRYIMAEQWLELKAVRKDIDRYTRSMSSKSKRNSPVSLRDFRALRRKLTRLVSQAQGLSLWR